MGSVGHGPESGCSRKAQNQQKQLNEWQMYIETQILISDIFYLRKYLNNLKFKA
jgi:hypothetical protein